MSTEIYTKYLKPKKGSTVPRIRVEANTGEKIFVNVDYDSLPKDARHYKAASVLFEKLKQQNPSLENLNLAWVNNKSSEVDYTFIIK